MHFEIHVEDQSGKAALEILVPKILSVEETGHTYRIFSYKGLGRIPRNLARTTDPARRFLLSQLPQLLRGYGKAFASYPANNPAAVIVVCDLDDRCLKTFRQELLDILEDCDPRPNTVFCMAIEEGESWLLGDPDAVRLAYPMARDGVLSAYEYDAICGAWEKLADAVYPGGAEALRRQGWASVGAEKFRWSRAIAPLMDVERNASPSFQYFCAALRRLAQSTQ